MTRLVCLDCRYLGDRPSGIGECVNALVEHLPEMAPDWRFRLLRSPRRGEPLSAAPNCEEVVVKAAANGPASAWWLPRIVDMAGIDLFHAPANILPRGMPVPCVTTVHDIMWLTHPQWCTARKAGLIERWFYGNGIRHALRHSAAIATVSAATRQEIVARGLAAAKHVHVTRSGVDPVFRPTDRRPELLQDLGIAADWRFVLIVGQNAPYKNHEGALRAFHAAFAEAGDMHLVLVQRRSAGAALEPLVRQLGLTGRVHRLTTVSRDELIGLYSAAVALLHPSLCEGFGNPLAEAMACGCPVVTSQISAMPEVTGDAALLVDPRDTAAIAAALCRVAHDPHCAARMRIAGLERARSLQWGDFARANLAVYRSVLEG